MQEISQIRITEMVKLDPDRLVELCVALGETGTEAIVADTMTELAVGIADLEDAYRIGDLGKINAVSSGLSKKAGHVGMTTFANVAGDVAECAEHQTLVPLAATLTRLRRVSDKTLTAVWDMDDISL